MQFHESSKKASIVEYVIDQCLTFRVLWFMNLFLFRDPSKLEYQNNHTVIDSVRMLRVPGTP